jgi:hypothetical protein
MADIQHVLKVAVRAGEKVFVHAKGDPATVLAYGAAAGIVVVATTVGYGSYYYGGKFLAWARPS